MKYTVYVLIDPTNRKVRYIGLTSTNLQQRLGTHLSKARHNYFEYQKDAWIRSLLIHNCKPVIRQLCIIDTLEEGRKLERSLITKYRDRLYNVNETGRNGKNTVMTLEKRTAISNSLKKQFSENNLYNPARKEIHVYNLQGRYLQSYLSGMIASKMLNIHYSAIYKCTSGITPQYAGYQFSLIKVDKMPFCKRKPKIIKDSSVQDFAV